MNQSTSKRHVIVVGAGIVGVSTALRARRHGFDVTLIDRLPPGDATSFGNAGVLASLSVVPVTVPGLLRKVPKMLADPVGPLYLRWRHLPKMASWLRAYLSNCKPERAQYIAEKLAGITGDSLEEHQSLAQGSPAERRIRTMGYAFAYRSRAAFDADAFAWDIRRSLGFEFEVFEGAAVREVEPTIGPNYQCLVVSHAQHGTIDEPGNYVKDLAATFAAEGGTIQQDEVTEIVVRDRRFTGVQLKGGGLLEGDSLALAGGVWSKQLLQPLGIDVPLEAERGYHVELHGANVQPQHAVSVTDGKFVATPMRGRLRLAGLVELAGIDAPPIEAPIKTLLTHARRIFPQLQWESQTEWMGRRPSTPDSLPVIGPVPDIDGVHLAFGHQHIGLTGGPRTGRLVADGIAGQRPNIDLAPYSVSRFAKR
jgi:D-amino-acid dehydrogenase